MISLLWICVGVTGMLNALWLTAICVRWYCRKHGHRWGSQADGFKCQRCGHELFDGEELW